MKDDPPSPRPLAGGAGGGHFLPRDTSRAKELRHQPSPAERAFWRVLSRGQVHGFKFSRQMPIGPYFADFLCRSAQLVVEIDGSSHDARQAHDERRYAFLTAQGFALLRFPNADVTTNLAGVVQAIELTLRQTEVQKDAHPQPLPQAGGEKVR